MSSSSRLLSTGEEKVKRKRRGKWDGREQRVLFVEKLRRHCKVQQPEDWSKVSAEDIAVAGGSTLLFKHYRGSRARLLTDLLPEHETERLKVDKRKPKGYWDDKTNCRAFLDRVKEEFSVKEAKDWGRVLTRHVNDMGGRSLLKRYNSSLLSALQDLYPEEKITDVECRPRRTVGHWALAENRSSCLAAIAKSIGIESTAEGWAHVTTDQIKNTEHGKALLSYYNGSLTGALRDILPGAALHRRSKYHWQSRRNRRDFMDLVAKRMNVKSESEWKFVSRRDIANMGGRTLVDSFPNVLALLSDVYPEKTFVESECRPLRSKGWWQDRERLLEFFEDAKKKLGVQEDEDWYRVSSEVVRSMPGGSFVTLHMSFSEALSIAYPKVAWDEQRLSRTGGQKRSTQRRLLLAVSDIFPSYTSEDAQDKSNASLQA